MVDLSSIYKMTKFITHGLRKRIREEAYTIKEISEETGKATSTISKLVNGETRSPHYSTAIELLKFLDVKLMGKIDY
jgi:transcriptional regulator with XRE-family HTH domain